MSGPGKFPRVESNVPPVTQALATLAGTDHDASATSHFSLDSDLLATQNCFVIIGTWLDLLNSKNVEVPTRDSLTYYSSSTGRIKEPY